MYVLYAKNKKNRMNTVTYFLTYIDYKVHTE